MELREFNENNTRTRKEMEALANLPLKGEECARKIVQNSSNLKGSRSRLFACPQ
jgi:hypothetical protein